MQKQLLAAVFVLALGAQLQVVPAAKAPTDDPFAQNVRTTPALTPAEEQKTFHLPPGFQIHLIASDPQIHKPLDLNFDSRGRLWLTQTHMYPYAAKPGQPLKDSIVVFEDEKGDGSYSKMTTFVDNLNIPMGIYPIGDGHNVLAFDCSATPTGETCLYTDTDGDGKADKREVLYTGWGYDRDTHGMANNWRRGFDGWIYGLHGFNNISEVKGKDGQSVHMRSGNTYRFRMDGSHIELFTEGQINPHGMCFDPLGNMYDSDSHSKPIYQILRGGKYEAFDRNTDDGLGLAPMMMHHLHGSTAIAGSQFYADDRFPEEFRGNVFTGNVVTCRINRDKLEYHGSSPTAIEMPDFLSTDDPWFRPVAIYLGPDGALYVSDFYNRIIGHYEVPLTHPGRDFESGRLWRITYNGQGAKPTQKFDVSKDNVEQLIARLADSNLTARLLVTTELSDRIGKDAIEPVKAMMKAGSGGSQAVAQKVHGLWVLYRLGAADEEVIASAARAGGDLRVHAMRVLAETPNWTPGMHELAVAALKDGNALVRRCAADALGQHPDAANVPALSDMLASADKDDTHLVYVIRMALRNQLSAKGSYAKLDISKMTPEQVHDIAEMSLAVPTSEAADYLLAHIGEVAKDREQVTKYLKHAVRYASATNVEPLTKLMKEKFPDDLDLQLESFQSIRQALEQRGEQMPQRAKQWGESLVTAILQKGAVGDPNWTVLPFDKSAPLVTSWNYESRRGAGSKDLNMLSSLPGGEGVTSILRSRPFEVPNQLNFWLAGHIGVPNDPPNNKNFVRLNLVSNSKTIAEAYPPRKDTPHKVTWKLDKYAGQQAYLEFTDGDNGNAYAWFAFAKLDPEVVPMPYPAPMALQQRLRFAAEAAGQSKIASVAQPLRTMMTTQTLDTETRASAASALAAINDAGSVEAMAQLVNNASEIMPLRQKIASALGAMPAGRETAISSFRFAPAELQTALAQAMTADKAGGEALLTAVQQGKAPARVLLVQQVHDRIAALGIADSDKRVKDLTKGVAAPKEELEKLLADRRTAFRAANAEGHLSPEAGQQVFAKNCAACHQIDGKGGQVGPQLAGLSKRGVDRLVEDILDPNRNVDPAFRYSNVFLKDGHVVTGLQKREEGEVLIFVDSTAKEIPVKKREIKQRFESPGSLMVSNFSEIISPSDFNNLLAYLLTK